MSGLSKVTIVKGQGGLGRRPFNQDKISGLLFFNSTVPSGFASVAIKKVYSLADAEALGLAQSSSTSGVEWYHVSEYFRGNPDGELWIGYFAVPGGAYAFTEISTMLIFAGGEIRQLGVYANALVYASTQITTIQAILTGMDDSYKQVSILYAANTAAITAVTGWAAIASARALTAPKVTPVICQDGGGAGAALYVAKSYSITCLGLLLGNISKSSVEQSVGNPQNFNISNGTEMEIPALANGDLNTALTLTALGGLKDKGYAIARKYTPDISGTYFERIPTSIVATSDYAWIESNRTIDKAIRAARTALIPQLQATIYVKPDGTLRDDTIGYFHDLCQTPITQMEADGELSGSEVLIDPTQDVLSTSNLTVTLKLLPVGIAEFITVNIGFTTNL
jgi:hypothetical protein